MSQRLFDVLRWLDAGYITEQQFDEWVETRVFLAFSIRCKDLSGRTYYEPIKEQHAPVAS